MAQYGHAIDARQIQIQNHQVVVDLAAHGARPLAILGHVDRVVFRLQSLAHKTGERRIVFGIRILIRSH